MTAIQLSKNWSINPNVRNAYVSLADMSGWFIYENHAYLKTKNWTVKFTSDGTTGPASNADTTDRITSKTAASTRGANATSVQSWSVLTSADGLQILFAFQGATDDIIRLSYSPGGLYVINVTDSRFQPTATDEVVWSTGSSIINPGTSLDRVMTIWASDDGKAWSNALFRNNAVQFFLGLERINNYCEVGVFTPPWLAYKYVSAVRNNSPISLGPATPTSDPHNVAVGTSTWLGGAARVFTDGALRTTRTGAGTVVIPNIPNSGTLIEDVFLSNTPALQNGTMPLFPLFLSGEKAVSLDGFLGAPMDWWVGMSASLSVPAQGDFFPGFEPGDVPGVSGGQTGIGDPRTNWFIALGSTMIRPWKNVAVSMQTI